jgi:hypothetical protein
MYVSTPNMSTHSKSNKYNVHESQRHLFARVWSALKANSYDTSLEDYSCEQGSEDEAPEAITEQNRHRPKIEHHETHQKTCQICIHEVSSSKPGTSYFEAVQFDLK